jgi:hypothetical protein
MSSSEVEAARFLGPKTGKTKVIAHTTGAGGANTDLSGDSWFANPAIEAGHFVTVISTTAVQFASGDSAVTIVAADPYIPADTPFSFIPQGKHLGLKSVTTNGNLYIWPSSAGP